MIKLVFATFAVLVTLSEQHSIGKRQVVNIDTIENLLEGSTDLESESTLAARESSSPIDLLDTYSLSTTQDPTEQQSSTTNTTMTTTTAGYEFPPTLIRLSANGKDDSMGRLELFFNYAWGTVCMRGFTHKDAEVACRMLGFTSGYGDKITDGSFGPGSGRILTDKPGCNGDESHFDQCESFSSENSCTHDEDVAIACKKQENVKLPEKVEVTKCKLAKKGKDCPKDYRCAPIDTSLFCIEQKKCKPRKGYCIPGL